MKILIGGDIEQGGTMGFCVAALKEIGVEVELLNYRQYFHLSFLNKALNKFRKTPYYFGVVALNKKLIEKTQEFRPDFILLFKPILVLPETVKKLTKLTKVFSWYPDYILFPKTCSTYFYESIPLYDYHFSFNLENSKELLKWGAKKSIFLPCAADLCCHRPIEATKEEKQELGSDIVFVGTYANEERMRFLEKLCQEGYDIKIYGNSWEKHPKNSCLAKRGRIQYKAVFCEEMSKVFNAGKIVLAFVRTHNKETLSCRSYEIPACGAFMLHERTEKIGEVFKEGEEAEFFGSYEELKKKIDFYLKNESLRKKIAKAGYEKIIKGGHLFIDRVKLIIDVFNGLG